jgi:UDP-glucose 4-epimerase
MFRNDSEAAMKVLIAPVRQDIGSIVSERLVDAGFQVIALDNLQSGHRQSIHPHAIFEQGDLLDADRLKWLLEKYSVDAVFHLAAESLIDLSMRDPGRFFRSNISGGINLLDALAIAGVTRLVLSSTAAVYGEPGTSRSPKTTSQASECLWRVKLALERMLEWYHRAHGINCISLRYFNACGATQRCGEFHVRNSHYSGLFEAAMQQRSAFHLSAPILTRRMAHASRLCACLRHRRRACDGTRQR